MAKSFANDRRTQLVEVETKLFAPTTLDAYGAQTRMEDVEWHHRCYVQSYERISGSEDLVVAGGRRSSEVAVDSRLGRAR